MYVFFYFYSTSGSRAALGAFELHHDLGALAVDEQELGQRAGLQTLLSRGEPAGEPTSSAARHRIIHTPSEALVSLVFQII